MVSTKMNEKSGAASTEGNVLTKDNVFTKRNAFHYKKLLPLGTVVPTKRSDSHSK